MGLCHQVPPRATGLGPERPELDAAGVHLCPPTTSNRAAAFGDDARGSTVPRRLSPVYRSWMRHNSFPRRWSPCACAAASPTRARVLDRRAGARQAALMRRRVGRAAVEMASGPCGEADRRQASQAVGNQLYLSPFFNSTARMLLFFYFVFVYLF